jgi:hypothetical protein
MFTQGIAWLKPWACILMAFQAIFKACRDDALRSDRNAATGNS